MKNVALSWSKALPNLAERHRARAERRSKLRPIGASVVTLPLLSLCGCSEVGAPSFEMFGAFFPAWLLCAVLGIFVALGARIFFADHNLVDALPLQLPVCTSLGAIFALLLWLLFFGR
jgi:YtcA family